MTTALKLAAEFDMYSPIILPLDGSELAEQAVPHALAQARAFNADIFIIRAISPIIPAAPMDVAPMAYQQVLEAETDSANQYVEEKVRQLRAEYVPVHGEARFGVPTEVILEEAREKKAGLIVMTTHGRSGIGRWVFGSVADRILREAHIPVLLVRAAEHAG